MVKLNRGTVLFRGGAGGSWTHNPEGTRFWVVRVYQFRHRAIFEISDVSAVAKAVADFTIITLNKVFVVQ